MSHSNTLHVPRLDSWMVLGDGCGKTTLDGQWNRWTTYRLQDGYRGGGLKCLRPTGLLRRKGGKPTGQDNVWEGAQENQGSNYGCPTGLTALPTDYRTAMEGGYKMAAQGWRQARGGGGRMEMVTTQGAWVTCGTNRMGYGLQDGYIGVTIGYTGMDADKYGMQDNGQREEMGMRKQLWMTYRTNSKGNGLWDGYRETEASVYSYYSYGVDLLTNRLQNGYWRREASHRNWGMAESQQLGRAYWTGMSDYGLQDRYKEMDPTV
ncbi:hypothetical protein B0H34DRAFT_847459 [Crassisporium funariophilum]|nr:hypothetical protein B0H34DRAFT_847459 [Crassisporium funariophilum]